MIRSSSRPREVARIAVWRHPRPVHPPQRHEARDFLGEILPEVDAMAVFELRDVDHAGAHELLDQVGAQHVVVDQQHAAPGRQLAGVDRGLPRAAGRAGSG
jgi:hypothetical protein